MDSDRINPVLKGPSRPSWRPPLSQIPGKANGSLGITHTYSHCFCAYVYNYMNDFGYSDDMA